jgi:hypothetical protein
MDFCLFLLQLRFLPLCGLLRRLPPQLQHRLPPIDQPLQTMTSADKDAG